MVLKQELCGYKEYIQRIRYRLIPFIWKNKMIFVKYEEDNKPLAQPS